MDDMHWTVSSGHFLPNGRFRPFCHFDAQKGLFRPQDDVETNEEG